MILLDTNVVVALTDPRDQHHLQAMRDLQRFSKQTLHTIPSVLAEAIFQLPAKPLRLGLWTWLQEADVQILSTIEEKALYEPIFAWLIKYEEHLPDWTDAALCVVSSLHRRLKLWTYDSEFRTTWRRPDGSCVPLALTTK
ncbi:MAG TPA: type II toxin-antitoxin system VapC family toxin [Phycisphaerae bacterium]|nr:type II toxin-antitoxin system VapC family toxin [Phycisphaerae bacterium]